MFELLAPIALLFQQAISFPAGTPVEKVECLKSPGKSYALYLPSAYRPDRTWPVLFCFDPRRRGMTPLKLFRPAAEELGYILICSNDYFSDGDINPAWEAVLAAWNDATSRFPFDPNRIYFTGFSGGARVSWVLADFSPVPIAGIIGIGAGLPWQGEIRPSLDVSRLSFYGLAGRIDFNYPEMLQLNRRLDNTAIPHHFVDFGGPHSWPPEEDAKWALRWMQAEALAKGLTTDDPQFRTRYFEGRIARSEARQAAGDWIGSEAALADLLRQLPTLSRQQGLPERLEEIRSSKPLARHIQERKRAERDYQAFLQTVSIALQPFRTRDARRPGFKQLQRDLDLARLQKRANDENPGKLEKRLAAQRTLQSVLTDTSFYIARELKSQGDYKALTTVLRVALEIAPKSAFLSWRLAGAWALQGRDDEALKALETALQKGFTRLDLIRRDPDLARIKNHPRFLELVADGDQ